MVECFVEKKDEKAYLALKQSGLCAEQVNLIAVTGKGDEVALVATINKDGIRVESIHPEIAKKLGITVDSYGRAYIKN